MSSSPIDHIVPSLTALFIQATEEAIDRAFETHNLTLALQLLDELDETRRDELLINKIFELLEENDLYTAWELASEISDDRRAIELKHVAQKALQLEQREFALRVTLTIKDPREQSMALVSIATKDLFDLELQKAEDAIAFIPKEQLPLRLVSIISCALNQRLYEWLKIQSTRFSKEIPPLLQKKISQSPRKVIA